MADLPLGWGGRHNQMSEHDMKLGGMAATKFIATGLNAYENDVAGNGNNGNTNPGYKNSDQVREHYLRESQKTGGSISINSNTSSSGDSSAKKQAKEGQSNVPDFWEERQKLRNLQAKQMGVFSNKPTEAVIISKENGRANNNNGGSILSLSAEVALVQTAAFALEKMTQSLRGRGDVKIPTAERAAFAEAVKGAMDALAKQT